MFNSRPCQGLLVNFICYIKEFKTATPVNFLLSAEILSPLYFQFQGGM